LTYSVNLPGGKDRLRELILYVCGRCADAPRFGQAELNKILWKADFEAFAKRGVPVTGRSYQRLKSGPAPIEMPPVLAELIESGELEVSPGDLGEERLIPTRAADLQPFFSDDDMRFVDDAIDRVGEMTAGKGTDDAQGIAWKSRGDLDPMPYESAYLSDEEPSDELLQRMKLYAQEAGLRSH
jgi:hypothetical protein